MCLLCQHIFSNEAMKPSRLNGEKLTLPIIRVLINKMIGQNQQEILSSVPLENHTVSKRTFENFFVYSTY